MMLLTYIYYLLLHDDDDGLTKDLDSGTIKLRSISLDLLNTIFPIELFIGDPATIPDHFIVIVPRWAGLFDKPHCGARFIADDELGRIRSQEVANFGTLEFAHLVLDIEDEIILALEHHGHLQLVVAEPKELRIKWVHDKL